MQVLHRIRSGSEPCHYLPDRSAEMEYEYATGLTMAEYEQRMNQGWRKFGRLLFHPVCDGCQACRPIRIVAADFTPDRSQQRAARRNADLTVRVAAPTTDSARTALFNRYHAAQAARKGWPAISVSADEYRGHFLASEIPAAEISLWDGETLRGIVLTEITPHTVSGIYHYHDPECRERSLGTFGMLQTLALARNLEKRWAYFGYYVADCGSLAYKARFQPNEVLGIDGMWHDGPQSA